MFVSAWCDKYYPSVFCLLSLWIVSFPHLLKCRTYFIKKICHLFHNHQNVFLQLINSKTFEHVRLTFTELGALANEIMLNMMQNLKSIFSKMNLFFFSIKTEVLELKTILAPVSTLCRNDVLPLDYAVCQNENVRLSL